MDWAAFQACLEDRLLVNPAVDEKKAVDKCVDEFASAMQEAIAAFAPKRRPRGDLRPPLPASIQDEMRLKNLLKKQWQVARDPSLKDQVNRLQRPATYLMNESRNDQWSDTLEFLHTEDQSL
jgi:hypothetical protein